MTAQDKRGALEQEARLMDMFMHQTDNKGIIAAFQVGLHAYAQAERLDEHVKTCEVAGLVVGESESTKACGDGWYCDSAPTGAPG